MKSLIFVLLLLSASALLAQQPAAVPPPQAAPSPQTGTPADTTSNPVTLAQPFEAGRNFFNFFAYANGIFDDNSATIGGSQSFSGLGFEAGGGVTGYHEFAGGSLALNYRGGYRNYEEGASFPGGTDQNLSFQFRKTLSRRWTLTFSQSAGIFLYGGTYFGLQPTQSNFIQTNPFTSQTRFLSSSLALMYQQTLRLSYSVEGDFFLTRYNGGPAIGDTGGSGAGSIFYRFSRRTTVSGTYLHTDMQYTHKTGTTKVDSAYLTLSRDLRPQWHLGISGGFSRVNSSGTVTIPVPVSFLGQIFNFYEVGQYHQVSFLPYYQGTLSHNARRSQLMITGGESVTPGNGFVLASRSLGVSGFYSYNLSRRANLGLGGGYSRLSSLSNAIASSYSTSTFSGSWGYNLARYVGLNLRYDLADYGGFGGYGGRIDNRVSFGFVFNSKNVPITLF